MMKLTNISLMEEKTGRYLVKDLSLTINKTTKLAIIGEEGNGKSSLLQVLRKRADLIPYINVSGDFTSSYERVGYLNQSLLETEQEMIVADLFEEVEWDSLLTEAMAALQIDNLYSTQLYSELSGGEQLKYQLLSILAKNPDFLLLDEPTNNLDLGSIKWLETFIKNIEIPVIYVSHDEAFIQETANLLLHLELTKRNQEPLYTIFHDDFLTYQEKRAQGIKTHNQLIKNENRALKKQEDKLQQVWNKAEHQHTNVARADPRLQKKVKALKQQKTKLNTQKEQVMDLRTIEEQPTFFFPPVSSPKKKQLIIDFKLDELKNVKGALSNNIALPIYTQDKIIITGENGVGKSTLLKQIYDVLKNKNSYNVGYMPQKYEEVIDTSQPVIRLLNTAKENQEQKIRTLLANLNFTRDEMTHQMNTLSGGQQAKVLLVKLMLENNNILILDEPTRNLSPLTNQFFYDALKNYQGTIISISHDRKFIDSLIDKKQFELTPETLFLKEFQL